MYNERKIQKGNREKDGVRMESLSERNENQRIENAKKWRKRKIGISVGAVIAVILFAVIFNVWNYYTKDYNSYKVLDSVKRKDSQTTKYRAYGDKLMKYNSDGVVGFDENLNMKWSGSFNFTSPIIDESGKYIAIADLGGMEVHVFDGSDSPKEVKVLYPIAQIRVATQGVLVVVMNRDSTDLVQIYDSTNGELLVEFTTNVSEDGYPVDVALSNDGTKLVTSYLNVTEGSPTSRVTFYNLGEVGKNYSNNIVAAKTYEKEIISKIEFIGNDTVCAFGERGYYLYSMRQMVDKVTSKKFKTKIKSMIIGENNFGFVFDSSSKSGKYKVVLYDVSGKEEMSQFIDFTYSNVYMLKDDIIFTSDQECHILRKNGNEKLNCKFKTPISFILPTEKAKKYILVDDNYISTIKIKEK